MHPIHKSLVRPALLGEGNRLPIAVVYVVAAMLLLTYPFTYVTVSVSLLLVIVGHGALMWLAYDDPDWWPVLREHLEQQDYYLAGPSQAEGRMLFIEYRKPQTYADILPYDMMPAPNVMVLKNKGLMAAFLYYGPDLELATEEELQALSHHLNAAFVKIGSGWTLHVDLFRVPSRDYPEEGAFPDATSRLIDEERRRQYRAEGVHYESVTCFSLTYEPPQAVKRSLKSLFVDNGKNDDGTMNTAVKFFNHQVEQVVNVLSARLKIERLAGTDLLTYVHRCTTGQSHQVAMPERPLYLDVLLGSQDLTGGYFPQVKELHTRVVTVTGFPAESKPAMLAYLGTLPCVYRWNTRFLFLDPHDARKEITSARRNFDADVVSVVDKLISGWTGEPPRFENLDAKALTGDANVALSELDSGVVRYGRYTSVLVVHHEYEETLEEIVRNIETELNNHMFPARVETKNAVEAILGSLPGVSKNNVRKRMMHTLNAADLMPVTTIWPGLNHNPCRYYPENSPPLLYGVTGGTTPFRLNLHVGDVGHFLMLGPTGAGKSTHNNFLMSQFLRYPGAQVRCFDRGRSAELITYACGGQHLDLASEGSVALCPLAYVHEESGRVLAAEWLESCLHLQGIEVSVQQRREIFNALEILAQEERRSMSTFISTVQDREVSEALKAYTIERPYGRLFDAEHDELHASHLTTFELGKLMEAGDKYLIPALLFFFQWIERGLDGRPTLVVIDEGWTALMHDQFAGRFLQWLRTFRDKNGAVGLITHSLADINRSQYKELLLQMCPTKIFLPDGQAKTELVRPLYEGIGLNERAINLLAEGMVPQRDYLVVSPDGSRPYQLGLGPVALAFCGKGGDENRRQWKALQSVNAETWPASWLGKCEAKEDAKLWREYKQQFCLEEY